MNRKYCEKCGFSTYNDEYNFCPRCSSKLIDEICSFVKGLFDKFSKEYVVKCENCREYFIKNYKTCPYCQNKLVKEDLFFIDFEKEEVSSKFREFSCTASFEDLFKHYVEAHWTMFPPGALPPEHDIYYSTLQYVEEYFKSDSSKYCRRCDKKYNSKLKYCPDCGAELIDFEISEPLKMARNLRDSYKVKRCDECLEEFSLDFKYCPICAKPLREEPQFWLDEENNLIKTYWNKKVISMPIYDYYIQVIHIANDAPLPVNMVHLKLYYKEKYDEKLVKSFSRRNLEVPKKLTCPQMEKIVSKLQNYTGDDLGFMNSEMIRSNFLMDLEELKIDRPDIIIIKLRKDLFYLYLCHGPVLWG